MIGEKLEEARKRKGISIREAAEATKIRGDYLLSMEDNSFEIALPQIYIRGFLKNYARFLQLDPNRILTDFDAYQLGRHSRVAAAAARSGRESLGHVEIPQEGERVVVTEPTEQDGPEPELRMTIDRGPEGRRPTPPPPTLERKGTTMDRETWNENKAMYVKIGVVFAGVLAVCLLLVVIIKLMTGKPGEAAPAADVAATAPATPTTTPAGQPLTDRLTVSATDSVTLIIEQTMDRKRLYSGTLNAGEKISVDKQGPVAIRFTNGSAIQIEKNGQQLRPGQAGVGRTVVD